MAIGNADSSADAPLATHFEVALHVVDLHPARTIESINTEPPTFWISIDPEPSCTSTLPVTSDDACEIEKFVTTRPAFSRLREKVALSEVEGPDEGEKCQPSPAASRHPLPQAGEGLWRETRSMDPDVRKRLEAFLLPLYQDLDGISRLVDIERVAEIARRLYESEPDDAFELLLLLHGLGRWLEKVGNASRTALSVGGFTEGDLRRTAVSIKRLENPETAAERAVAGAVLIDQAGVRGLSIKFASARREGHSLIDVVREELASAWIPEWMPERGRQWLERRFEAKRRVCREVLEELSLEDYVRSTPARS